MSTKKRKTTRVSTHNFGSASGLLNSKGLIQATDDEKLVVATLATLDSGNAASSLIKQELKWIIQSRRKAEGKEEIQIEFKNPMKDELTSEEVHKRVRRRELNRLAARRSRDKSQKRRDKLVEEIKFLQSQNMKLKNDLTYLADEKDNIVQTLKMHMIQCSDYTATKNAAAAGVPPRILEKFGMLQEDMPTTASDSTQSNLPQSEERTIVSHIKEGFLRPETTIRTHHVKYVLERSMSCPSSSSSSSFSSPGRREHFSLEHYSPIGSASVLITQSDEDIPSSFEDTPSSSYSSLSGSQSSTSSFLNEQEVPLDLTSHTKGVV